jgi:D-serine deaminase-like pyridoxal phosphate-dependent protein
LNCGYGRLLDLDGAPTGITIDSLSQEHGILCQLDEPSLAALKFGTRVRVLPNHSCLTAANHSHYNVFEAGRVVAEWRINSGW